MVKIWFISLAYHGWPNFHFPFNDQMRCYLADGRRRTCSVTKSSAICLITKWQTAWLSRFSTSRRNMKEHTAVKLALFLLTCALLKWRKVINKLKNVIIWLYHKPINSRSTCIIHFSIFRFAFSCRRNNLLLWGAKCPRDKHYNIDMQIQCRCECYQKEF